MKTCLIPLFAILAFGCFAAKKSPQVPTPQATSSDSSSLLSRDRSGQLRTEEVVKAYPMGRYVDPASGRLMHEKHTVYRVEEDANWNLRNVRPEETPSTSPEISRGHLSALAEQNTVLEKKIRMLEKEHTQCLEKRRNLQFYSPPALVRQERHQAPANTLHSQRGSLYLKDELKGDSPSLLSVE